MNVEILGRKAISIIKEKWGLPKTGFIAGGSIANIVWELVSSNEAVVNDIDVFIFDSKIENLSIDKKSLFEFQERVNKYCENYNGINRSYYTKYFYAIVESDHDGMFNTIKYQSNTEDQSIIIKSFDINATKIGYSIDEDKIYWEPEFEEFLKTGELKVCNLSTPSHTAIRIAKKSKELNAKLDIFELKLIQFAMCQAFSGTSKSRFRERYHDIYNQNLDILKDFFRIVRDLPIENYVKMNFNEIVEIYKLEPCFEKSTIADEFFDPELHYKLFDDPNIKQIYNSNDFMFYMRHVYDNDRLKSLWPKLFFFLTDIDYVDKEVSQDDIDLLSRFSMNAPNSIENLRGYKLSEQIEIIKKFLDKFKDDPIVAISILEKMKVDKDVELDDQTVLLLELSVRKKIVNDTKGKVRKILDLPVPASEVNDKQPFPDWL